jgi:hypothetical protein
MLCAEHAQFPLARKLHAPGGAPLGEVFAFLSALYFRGKLTYARAFSRAPAGLPGVLVITPGEGLCRDSEPLTAQRLRALATVPIDLENPYYSVPLVRDARALHELAGEQARFVLLGSVASGKYVKPLLSVFGERLLFPADFVGRGDMSRGGLLLRAARDGRELAYTRVHGAVLRGRRPPRLPKLGRTR